MAALMTNHITHTCTFIRALRMDSHEHKKSINFLIPLIIIHINFVLCVVNNETKVNMFVDMKYEYFDRIL